MCDICNSSILLARPAPLTTPSSAAAPCHGSASLVPDKYRTNKHTFVRTFSKLGGETTEKHSKNTSVWGYESGRRRLCRQPCHFQSHDLLVRTCARAFGVYPDTPSSSSTSPSSLSGHLPFSFSMTYAVFPLSRSSLLPKLRSPASVSSFSAASSCLLRPPPICPFLLFPPLPSPSMLSPSSFSLLDSPPFPCPSLHFSVRNDSLIVFLARRIPQAQIDRHAIHHDLARIVVKDSGDVFAGKGVGGVRDQEACLLLVSSCRDSAFALGLSPKIQPRYKMKGC